MNVSIISWNHISVTGNICDHFRVSGIIRRLGRQTDRYFIDRNKSHYRFICHSNKRNICTCIYKNVILLKSYMTIYIVTTKIMLNGIAIIKTGYFSNTNAKITWGSIVLKCQKTKCA